MGGALAVLYFKGNPESQPGKAVQRTDTMNAVLLLPPDTAEIQQSPDAALIRYGRELITNTRKYLGPKGIVAQISNQLNCQSCHLEAGTKAAPYSANFMGVAANYPLFRNRSGMLETIQFRINDCMIRSMDGKRLDTNMLEMKALTAYILWVGKDVPPKTKPVNASLERIPYLQRAADTIRGKQVYIAKCQLCHGASGGGSTGSWQDLFAPAAVADTASILSCFTHPCGDQAAITPGQACIVSVFSPDLLKIICLMASVTDKAS